MKKITQNCNNHVALDNFHRTIGKIVDVMKGISLVYQIFAWSTKRGPYVQREKLEAAVTSRLENWE